MAEYIDREAIYRKACRGCTRHGDEIGTCYLEEPCEELQAEFTIAPAADVVPVRHGRWIGPETEKDDPKIERGLERWHCSCCGCEAYVSFGPPVDRFCLMCGAKMDEIERRK